MRVVPRVLPGDRLTVRRRHRVWVMHGMHVGRWHVPTRRGWSHSRHHWLPRKLEHWGCNPRALSNTAPDRGSIEGKHKRSRETAPAAEPSPPRTMAVAPVGGQGERGVVNAVVSRGAA